MDSTDEEEDHDRPPISESLSPAPTHSSSHSDQSSRPISTTPMATSPSATISSTTSTPPSNKSKISFSIESCILGNTQPSSTSTNDTSSSTTAPSYCTSQSVYIPQPSPPVMVVSSSSAGLPQSIPDVGPARTPPVWKYPRFHPWISFAPR